MFVGVFITVFVSTDSAHCPKRAARAYPVGVESQTLSLSNLLPHEPSVVLDGAEALSGADVVDLD